MKYDAAWLISVFAFSVAMAALYTVSRARTLWQGEATRLTATVKDIDGQCRTEMEQMRTSLGAVEAGLVNAQASLREGRLNLSVRGEALRMLRLGAAPDAVAGKMGLPLSEVTLLKRVGLELARAAEAGSSK
jgi:hypothetical protein